VASSTQSFDDLISSRLLDVPDYQRGYAWERTHLEEFWEDLELLASGGRHYTGTVVLRSLGRSVQDEAREVPLDQFDVVDGQQRLATCTLLLDRICDRLDVLGDDEVPAARRRLLTAIIGGVKRPKLQLGPDLRTFWEDDILQGMPAVQGPRLAAEHRLRSAADFFEARLDAAQKHADGTDVYRRWLRRLAGKVTGSLQFTLYDVGDDSEVGVIFETLNQRGKELSELEKTKNYLLYLASQLADSQRADLARTINASWSEIFANLGASHLGPVHEDQLLRAHWLATQDPRPAEWHKAKSVKDRFHRRRYIDDRQLLYPEVTAYATSLRKASLAYRDIVTEAPDSFTAYGDQAPAVRRLSRQLRQAGVVAIFAPLLIAARLRFPTDGTAYASLVDICERYSVRVFLITERRGNAGASRLYNLAHLLHRDGDFRAVLDGVTDRIRYFADDETTEAELLNVKRNWYAKTGHKYFLYQYELHLLGGAAPVLAFEHFTRGEYRASTTEHVLPQTPAGSCWRVFKKADRALYTHSLGNLVLTNNNAVYGNHCFSRKRDGVDDANGSRCPCYATAALLQEQELAGCEEWTPRQVVVRQERLARWAMEHWRITPAVPTDSAPVADPDVLAGADIDADADPMLTIDDAAVPYDGGEG
jgi:hypothetical protein